MTYIAIAEIAKCSQGAVSCEIKEGKEQRLEDDIPLPLSADFETEKAKSPELTSRPLEIIRF
jgi:hypothetical protein